MPRTPVLRPPLSRLRAARLALAAFFVAALTACGPLAPGDAVRVDYRPGATYDVPAGGTLYVVAELDLDDLGLTEQDVRDAGLTWIPLGIRGESANALGWIVMAPPEAPADWEVRSWEIRVIRERPVGRPDAPGVSRVQATVRVDVPESAFDLTRRVSVRLAARSGGATELTFLVAAR
jgi:hypothetical protein